MGPVTILQIYVVLLILIPPTHIIGPLGGIGTPAAVVGLGALMLWVLAVLSPDDHLKRTVLPVRIVIGTLVGSVLVAYAVLHTRSVPMDELLSSDRMILQVMSWAGVVLLGAECLRDRSEVYRVLRTAVFAVAVMAVIAVVQFYSGFNLAMYADMIPGLQQNSDLFSVQARSGFRRPAGTATHPIEYACVVAMALPLALHLARYDVTKSQMRRWAPLGAIALGVPVAVSRSAVLGAVVGLLVVFIGLDPKVRPRALVATGIFAVALYATTPGLLGTIRNLFVNAGSDSSITTRTSDYQVVGEFLRESPFIGRGPGTFLPRYLILDNQYLLSAIEIGLIGLAAVIVYFLATAFLARGARHRSSEPGMRDLGQSLAAAGLAGCVAAFTFDAFSFLMFAGFIPVCLGLAGALWMLERIARGEERRRRRRISLRMRRRRDPDGTPEGAVSAY
jgi:hypothetical protein